MSWWLLLKIALFLAAFLDGIFISVLLHELGHALAALALTQQPILLQVGRSSAKAWQCRVGRLTARLSLRGFRNGYVQYDRASESNSTLAAITLAGPLVSLMLLVALVVWLSNDGMYSLSWIVAFAFFVANFRILLVSLLPIAYRNRETEGETWRSDALEFWRLMKSGK